jgi:hypothetical protein
MSFAEVFKCKDLEKGKEHGLSKLCNLVICTLKNRDLFLDWGYNTYIHGDIKKKIRV